MNKLFNRIFEAYVFAYAFFFASRPLSDADFWFHLKTGEYIIGKGLIPRTDPFSYVHFGRPWTAHGWLSGVVFYVLYSKAGPYSLSFLFALLTALAFWIVYRRCESHPFIAGFATLLGVWTVLPTIGVRPRVFSLLFASGFLAVLNRYAARGEGRLIWLLVPLTALWTNLHGGFFIGLALIVLTIIGVPLDAWAAGEKIKPFLPRLRVLSLVLLGCLLAALLNPYGVRIYSFLLGVLTSSVFQEMVVDWLSPNFHQPESRPLILLMLLTIAAIALSPKRVRPSEVLLFLATLYATLKAQRNLAIFALVAAPLFAHYVQSWLDSTSFGKTFGKPRSTSLNRWPILVGLLLLLPLFAFVLKLKRTVYSPPDQKALTVPVKAVDYLRENGITGHTFTDPNIWGGYLLWALPSNPVYIDGRDMYPEQFVKEFVDIIRGIKDWRAAFDRYDVKVVIVRPASMLARELGESSDWERVYQDEMSVVFKRR
jgi:hypothetical protein